MADLAALIDPSRAALVTMEMQRGVVGDLAMIPVLADAVAASGTLAKAATLVQAARTAGVPVVHCTVGYRADGAGSSTNAPLLRLLERSGSQLVAGTPAAELVPELGPEPTDVVCARTHGLTPFPGTELDAILRNLDIHTIVATGVSLNVGIPGLAMGGVDRGYEVVVVTDAVAGMPAEYAEMVIEHTIAPLATRATSEQVVAVWS